MRVIPAKLNQSRTDNPEKFDWTFEPGGHPQEKPESGTMTRDRLFEYMREAPWRIERAVY